MGKGAAKGALEGAKDGLISGMVMGGVSAGISSMSGNPMFCFVAGTTVLTTLGKKAIETIQVGDVIPCVDHITGESAEKRVVTTTVNKVDRLIELDIDGEIIQCTETHPFQVKGKGWVNASDLAPNDVVYTKDWNTAVVKSVSLLELDEPVEVFNFEVEDCHTYFVGNQNIIVHNTNCGASNTSELSDDALRNIGQPGENSGFRVLNGTHEDAMDFVRSQTTGLTEFAPDKFMGHNSRGVLFTIFPKVLNNYTSIRINGVSGLKGIKFLWL